MDVTPVTQENREQFLAYCDRHGKDHDESFLPDATKLPHPDYPAYVLRRDEEVAGAVCLVRTPAFVAGRKARFMIFHSSSPFAEGYRALLESTRPHWTGLSRLYGFLPDSRTEVRQIWELLGLTIERYSYVLSYRAPAAAPPDLPAGFEFRSVLAGDPLSLAAAVDLDNLNFAGQPGHVEYSVEKLAEDLATEETIEGGLMLLYDRERPLGTVWVSRDEEQPGASFVSMLTVHPEYRGRGLGRALLRQSIAFSRQHGLDSVYLSVSAENEAAVRLYRSEGFTTEKVMVCYQMRV